MQMQVTKRDVAGFPSKECQRDRPQRSHGTAAIIIIYVTLRSDSLIHPVIIYHPKHTKKKLQM
jgi:hypothetical protein